MNKSASSQRVFYSAVNRMTTGAPKLLQVKRISPEILTLYRKVEVATYVEDRSLPSVLYAKKDLSEERHLCDR
jgi:hypothetical protein